MQLDNFSQFKAFMEILERIVSWIFEQVLMKIDKFPIEIYELSSFLPLKSRYPVKSCIIDV